MKTYYYATLVFIMAYLARIHRIEKGNFVIWDEAHFGKFSSKYLNRTFYFDVHPPLGKLLTALSGYIYNQKGENVDFSSSDPFPSTFDYVGMRKFHAFIASFPSLFGFLMLREFDFSLRKAVLLSSLFIFENGNISISRLVLLDSHLLAFTTASLYVTTLLFTRRNTKNYNQDLLLCTLGILLGCVMSVKWVGCFTATQIGLYIAYDLYKNSKFKSVKEFSIYFLKRVIFLIFVPIAVYAFFFFIHFQICNKSGSDDGFFSSHFQVGLKGGMFKDLKKYISYGNQITIKSKKGYLHSHFHSYPDHQQANINSQGEIVEKDIENDVSIPLQVTSYGYSDKNNNFYFQKLNGEDAQFLKNGDHVALLHAETQGYIMESNDTAFISEGFKIVAKRIEDSLDISGAWEVILDSDFIKKEKNIKAVSSKFFLKNIKTGHYLCASDKLYPSWGFSQGEIFAAQDKNENCLFNIEENFFSMSQGNEAYENLKPTFIQKIIESNQVMWKINNSFKQDPDLEPETIVSKAYEWPILKRGLRMSQWNANYKFYMFMNPFILLSTTIAIVFSPLLLLKRFIYLQRSSKTNTQLDLKNTAQIPTKTLKQYNKQRLNHREYESAGSFATEEQKCEKIVANELKVISNKKIKNEIFCLYVAIGGWFFHYIPFCILGRVLYLHHYFPSLYFATISLCYAFKKRSYFACSLFVFMSIVVFCLYSPLTYGFIDQNKVRWLRLFKSWNFVDN